MILNGSPLTLTRIITVYFVQGSLFVFFLYLAFRIIQREKKKLNYIFSAFYIFEAVGLFINFIYAPIAVESIVKVLNFLTNFFSFYAPIFLLIFILILLKSEKAITPKKQLIILIVYGIILFSMIFIAFIPDIGVEIINGAPRWGWVFFVYVSSVVTLFSTIPTLYFSWQIFKQFGDQRLQERRRYFLGGCIVLYIFLYSIFFNNTTDPDSPFRTVVALAGLFLTISASILLYYGVGRQLD
ncbi:MAG: hypothetical protein GF329_02700 [Candidatus Lokiarchaeota archaeon]|nr:hypothetical protein [Candidatus Lokiarchaeota archaeon]